MFWLSDTAGLLLCIFAHTHIHVIYKYDHNKYTQDSNTESWNIVMYVSPVYPSDYDQLCTADISRPNHKYMYFIFALGQLLYNLFAFPFLTLPSISRD